MFPSRRYTYANFNIWHILRPVEETPMILKTPSFRNITQNFKGNARFTSTGKYKGLPPTCGHSLCHDYYCRGLALGITVLVIQDKQFIFGIEANGDERRKNKITMCMGHRNEGETCWLQTAVRELEEEFHISMSIEELKHRIIVEFIHKKIVATFVINASGLNFDEMNKSVIQSAMNPEKDCYNEMTNLLKIPFVDLLNPNTNRIFEDFTYTIANHYSRYIL